MSNINYAQKTWTDLINLLLEEKIITQMSYDNWFQTSEAINMDSKSLTIQTEDDFSKNWISDNYLQILQQKLFDLLGQDLAIFIVVKTNIENEAITFSPQPQVQQTQVSQQAEQPLHTTHTNINQSIANLPLKTNLNEKFTFETFVSGSSNQLAYNIAHAISENPGSSYNPLFLYGGSGLGKTHLIQAIGNYIVNHDPTKKVLYVTSEAFLSDYVNSIRTEKTTEFREKYRQIDVLIIDDIQFFVGKEGIQEEFFHTFNHLHQLNKQIIITSDSQPNELTTLTERLRSRFSWGILTDIQAPDLETRMAILYKKIGLLADGEEIPEEVIEYIASNIDTNVRDLEGALNSLFAHAIMLGKIDITLDLAVEALRAYTKKDSNSITIAKIQKTVAKYFHISVDDLKSKARREPLSTHRHIAVYLCKTLTSNSLQKIGKQFGNRDHTTIMNSVRKIEELKIKDPDIKAIIEELKRNLQIL